jgi:hypothetical protein
MMPTIKWGIGDTFQVLSREDRPPVTLDVEIYGIFVKNGSIIIFKRKELIPPQRGYLESAREDFEGGWVVENTSQKATDGYSMDDSNSCEAVPLDIYVQWIPEEVERIFSAVKMTLGTY